MAKPSAAGVGTPSGDLSGEAGAHVPSTRLNLLTTLRLYRDYRLLWLGTVLTQLGQWMFTVTLGWLMLVLTNSAGWVGLIGFASGVPFLLVSIPAGVIIDRVDRRLVLVACQAVAMVNGLGLALLASFGHVQPWHLLVASVVNGAAIAVNNATRQTVVPTFVRREHLQNGIAVLSAGQSATRILGPSLGGPAIALLGSSGALYFQAAFLLAALISTMMLPPALPTGKALVLRRNLIDGVSYMARSPILTGLTILAAVPSLLIFPYIQFLPVYARDILHIGADGLGLLLAAGGTGSVLGALVIASLANLRRQGMVILAGTVVYALLLLSFAYATVVPLSVGLLFCVGLVGSSYMALNNTLLHEHVSDEMRGRVMGVYMLTSGLSSIGAWPMGFVGDLIGVPSAIALGAVLTCLITIGVGARSRAMRTL